MGQKTLIDQIIIDKHLRTPQCIQSFHCDRVICTAAGSDKRNTACLFLFLFFVILWEVAAEFSWIDSFIFSSPLRIAKTAWQMLQDGSLIMHIGVTLSETLISFALVVICGILLAILLWMLPMV